MYNLAFESGQCYDWVSKLQNAEEISRVSLYSPEGIFGKFLVMALDKAEHLWYNTAPGGAESGPIEPAEV